MSSDDTLVFLNLGSGGKKLEGHINVDNQPMEDPDVLCDLGSERWPFNDSSVDGAIASHILEHLNTDQFFHFLKELWRVCKPGAIVRVVLPHPRHDIFLNDPTHQRPVTPGTLIMFSKEYWHTMQAKGLHLTPFWKYLGIDLKLNQNIRYALDPSIDDKSLPQEELSWLMAHQNNVIREWQGEMEVVKTTEESK